MKKFTILLLCMLVFTGMARSQFMEDFEHIRLNVMTGGAEDDSEMRVVPNPDMGEANPSNASGHVQTKHEWCAMGRFLVKA
jgi:hypothetical protein